MMRLPWYGKTVPHAVLDILRGFGAQIYFDGDDVLVLRGELPDAKTAMAVIRAWLIMEERKKRHE